MYKRKGPSMRKENLNPNKSKPPSTPEFDYTPRKKIPSRDPIDSHDTIPPSPKPSTTQPAVARASPDVNNMPEELIQRAPCTERSNNELYDALKELQGSVDAVKEAVASLRVEMRASQRRATEALVDENLIIFPLSPESMKKLEGAEETSQLRLAYVSKP